MFVIFLITWNSFLNFDILREQLYIVTYVVDDSFSERESDSTEYTSLAVLYCVSKVSEGCWHFVLSYIYVHFGFLFANYIALALLILSWINYNGSIPPTVLSLRVLFVFRIRLKSCVHWWRSAFSWSTPTLQCVSLTTRWTRPQLVCRSVHLQHAVVNLILCWSINSNQICSCCFTNIRKPFVITRNFVIEMGPL